jgi:hypothetical protein
MTTITNHIQYGSGFTSSMPFNFYLLLYACTVVLPCFVASIKGAKIFGGCLLVSLILTYVFMIEAFTSVWCFCAAILSVIVLWTMLVSRDGGARANERKV